MTRAVLLVDSQALRRASLARELASRQLHVAEAPSLFQGIAALGRADFAVLLVAEGRPASMRGICRLARKRHPSIHILVLQKTGSVADAVRSAAGVTVHVVEGDAAATEIAARVEAVRKMPAPMEWDPLTTGMVQVDVAAALAEEQEHPPDDDSVFEEPDLEGPSPLVEGSLEGESGAALLMGLFAQDATGTLVVEAGPARGRFRFAGGEPVGEEQDDDALWSALSRAGKIKKGAPRPQTGEGRLAETLVKAGTLSEDALKRHRQDSLKDRLRALIGQKEGAWRFLESETSRAVDAPRINPFGVILDHHRRSMSPDRLLVVGRELEDRYLLPGTALAIAAPRLTAFAKGADVAALITGRRTVGEFYEATRLDLLMGALVVLTMVDAQLVSLADKPAVVDKDAVALARAVSPAVTGRT